MPNKKLKKETVSEEQEVRNLFSNKSKAVEEVGVLTKRFLYKMFDDVSKAHGGNTDKISLNDAWRHYFGMDQNMQTNSETNKPYLNSKEEMKNAIQQMEADDLCMLDGDQIILMNQ